MSYPAEWLHDVVPALPNSLLVVREIVAAESVGGIILSESYTTGVKKPQGWILESSSPDYKRGDAVLLSVGVTNSMVFGEGEEQVEVFIATPSQLIMVFRRMPASVELQEDYFRGHKPLPPDCLALRYDRRADEGRPIATRADR